MFPILYPLAINLITLIILEGEFPLYYANTLEQFFPKHVLTSKAQDVHENVSLNTQNVHIGYRQNEREDIPLLPPSFFSVSEKFSQNSYILNNTIEQDMSSLNSTSSEASLISLQNSLYKNENYFENTPLFNIKNKSQEISKPFWSINI